MPSFAKLAAAVWPDGSNIDKQDIRDWGATVETAVQQNEDDIADILAEAGVRMSSGTGIAAINGDAYLDSLRVTAAASPTYENAYRSYDTGPVRWYFMLSAIVLSGAFSDAQARASVEVAMNRGLVAPRQASAAYTSGTKVVIDGKVFFCNLGGTTAAGVPVTSGITTAGQFLVDGTVTWEYLGLTVPLDWEWFLVDVDTNLFNVLHPDSCDAYAGMLIAAARAADVDAEWLLAASPFPGLTRIEVLQAVAAANITDDIASDLAWTFQGGNAGDGTAYDIRFLADNVEAWRGLTALADLLDRAGDTASAATALTDAATLKTGILALWDSGATRFRTYLGQTGHAALTGDAAFVSDFRFHAWPILHGLLATETEVRTYGAPVIGYTVAQTPGLFTAVMDASGFVMGEWFYMAAGILGMTSARDTYARRVQSSAPTKVTCTDAALWRALRTGAPADVARTLDHLATGAAIYDSATDGTVANVEFDLSGDYDYRLDMDALGHNAGGTATIDLQIWGEDDAAWSTAIPLTTAFASTARCCGSFDLANLRRAVHTHMIRGDYALPASVAANAVTAGAAMAASAFWLTAQRGAKIRIVPSSGSLSAGALRLTRRPIVI